MRVAGHGGGGDDRKPNEQILMVILGDQEINLTKPISVTVSGLFSVVSPSNKKSSKETIGDRG